MANLTARKPETLNPHGAATSPADARFTATLATWDPTRDEGEVLLGGEAIPVDRESFEDGQGAWAASGQRVRFLLGVDDRGQRSVREMVLEGPPRRSWSIWRGLLALMLVGPVLVAVGGIENLGMTAMLVIGGLSVVRLGLQWADWDTQNGERWRVPGRILHTVEVFGGWPGAIAAPLRPGGPRRGIVYHTTLFVIVATYHLLAWEFLLDWPMTRLLMESGFAPQGD